MKKETYKDVVSELERLTAIKEEYDALISCGIPQAKAHCFDIPYLYVDSGFSMGEEIVIRCNKHEILKRDFTKDYAKSCKWKAKHGYIVVDFTKKDLRTYIELWERSFEIERLLKFEQPIELREKRRKEDYELHQQIKACLNDRINYELSTISKRR